MRNDIIFVLGGLVYLAIGYYLLISQSAVLYNLIAWIPLKRKKRSPRNRAFFIMNNEWFKSTASWKDFKKTLRLETPLIVLYVFFYSLILFMFFLYYNHYEGYNRLRGDKYGIYVETQENRDMVDFENRMHCFGYIRFYNRYFLGYGISIFLFDSSGDNWRTYGWIWSRGTYHHAVCRNGYLLYYWECFFFPFFTSI